ncbi:hypothetical protein GF314_01680 [bacterium]|nr:hypothetical protein [bacterium]
MLQRILVLTALTTALAGAATGADFFATGSVGITDQMSEFDKDIVYADDQYRGSLDVAHGNLSYRLNVGARLADRFELSLNYEMIDAVAEADDEHAGVYDISGTAVYLGADLVLGGGESIEGSLGFGVGLFDADGSIEAFGEPYDPENPADFEYTVADVSGDGLYVDVHAGVNLYLTDHVFLRPSLEGRILAIDEPEVTIDDSQRPDGVDPRPEDLSPAADDFELDYSGMVVRLSLGYFF